MENSPGRSSRGGEPELSFDSRRSAVMGRRGVVSSSQPLASSAGARILLAGGNATDAAVAMAAALAVTEPCSTGIGGDAFALVFRASDRSVSAVCGAGRAPMATPSAPPRVILPTGPEAVTVPGAAAAWVDLVDGFGSGRVSLDDVLRPAIELARSGFPVAPLAAWQWKRAEPLLITAKAWSFLVHDADAAHGHWRAPAVGEVFVNEDLARTLERLASRRKPGFYAGFVADAIVHALSALGGVMSHDDLAQHATDFTAPIRTEYHGVQVYEVPPPTHGIAALMALNLAEGFHFDEGGSAKEAEYLHTMIECMRVAYADARAFVADPRVSDVPTAQLLDKAYAAQRRALIRPGGSALSLVPPGDLDAFKVSETVQFCAVDADGNACSMINSNFLGFGTAIVPRGCGFTLHNRALNFSVDRAHPNCIAPGKRPYHTIIPALATRNGQLYAAFGVMGGFMQPQGHFQVMSNLVDRKMDPQAALDAPRFCVGSPDSGAGYEVYLEDGVPDDVSDELRRRGHRIVRRVRSYARCMFGRGQLIVYSPHTAVATAGSDPRADGLAIAI